MFLLIFYSNFVFLLIYYSTFIFLSFSSFYMIPTFDMIFYDFFSTDSDLKFADGLSLFLVKASFFLI